MTGPIPSLEELFQMAVARGASDLVLTAGAPPILRVNGKMTPLPCDSLTPGLSQNLAYGLLRSDQVARFERQKELDFSFTFQRHRFRGNLFLQRGAVGSVYRLVASQVPTFDQLHLPPIVADLALRHQGLILVTGPTGHGKSTTQAAMVEWINRHRQCHIVTVEDPIEFLHANQQSIVEQREVGDDTLTFADALRHVLRQAPDVVLVGEMRDMETMQAALTAAETGHLVISTLHTNDAVQAIDRLVDSFPEYQQGQVRSQLSMSLLAVLAQRLIPRADKPGRILAMEVLVNTYATANLIREEKLHQIYTVMETSAKDGMVSMDFALRDLVHQGLVAQEEARRRMRNPVLLDRHPRKPADPPASG